MGNPSTFAMTTDVPGTSKNTGHIQDPRENHPPERNALTGERSSPSKPNLRILFSICNMPQRGVSNRCHLLTKKIYK